jgi:signal transduction histidine kinase
MDESSRRAMPGCLRGYPGAVLQLSPDGTVIDSNARLEAALGRHLVGRRFAEALDHDSCGAKWERLLACAPSTTEAVVAELVLVGEDTLAEPREFSVMWEARPPAVWLVEHPRDPRLDRLREQVVDVNSELANAQRALLKERSRLAHALGELETRNEALVATTRELERSNRALDEFAHAVSHDLKAPLRSIGNSAQWLADDLGEALGVEPREHMERLKRQVRRMRTMIDGILDYARAGRETHAPETVELGALVRELEQLLDPPPGVTIEVEGEAPTIRTARAPLAQVLQNLVDNAVKHAGPTARVRVSARRDGAWVEVAVSDDGPGIPARLQERIWRLFSTLGAGADGHGVGLAVVRRLVEAQGGRIWIASGEGRGATFRFLWPAEPGDESERG